MLNAERVSSFPPLTPSSYEIHRRIHALVDIGEYLIGFTIEEIDGAYLPRARVFEFHTRAWLPVPVPIRDLSDEWDTGLPIDGHWQMQLIDYCMMVCIYTNPSNCRLIYILIDRTATRDHPFSLNVCPSRDIRPVISILIDRSLHCTVLYEHVPGGEERGFAAVPGYKFSKEERVSIVTDDYQYDRNSVRLWEIKGEGQIVEIGACNLTDTTEGFVVARSASGDILMTSGRGEGILVDRETGDEKRVEIGVHPICQDYPIFKSPTLFITLGCSFTVDLTGFLWSLNANQLMWRKHSMSPFRRPDSLSSLTLTSYGRVLCVHHFKRREGDEVHSALPQWQPIQPASLKELAQTRIYEEMAMDKDETDQVLCVMSSLRRGYDTTISFVLAIDKLR